MEAPCTSSIHTCDSNESQLERLVKGSNTLWLPIHYDKINQWSTFLHDISTILYDIRLLKTLLYIVLVYLNSNHNQVSYRIAKFALHLIQELEWEGSFPVWLPNAAGCNWDYLPSIAVCIFYCYINIYTCNHFGEKKILVKWSQFNILKCKAAK